MDKIPTKISISIKEGIIEFSGSEKFIQQQLEKFKDTIDKVLGRVNEESNLVRKEKAPVSSTKTQSSTVSDFGNVFDIQDNDVTIIAKIPGEKKPEKTVNAALLYLFGKNLVGIKTVPFTEIRKVCEDQGFLDKTNFAFYMKKAQTQVVPGGAGKSMTARLTVPGERDAKNLAERLQNEEQDS